MLLEAYFLVLIRELAMLSAFSYDFKSAVTQNFIPYGYQSGSFPFYAVYKKHHRSWSG